ncbi:MAG: GxxExxY protein [Kiritimatiellae bacterium]|nr:GxxExxY protein [Kiritimatiellia bacterium]
MTENEISAQVLDAAIAVHNGIGGPGLLESYYESALTQELRSRGLKVETQKRVPVIYKGVEIGEPYRLDMLVEDKVIVECKATEKNNPVFAAQVFTYLRLTNLKLGLVVNFGQKKVKDGFERVANKMPDESPRLSASASLR